LHVKRDTGAVINLLFLCSRNRLRSPTAEQVFARHPGVETASAGLAPDAEEECSVELVEPTPTSSSSWRRRTGRSCSAASATT
jgi:protein-tyrosine-phosphatase